MNDREHERMKSLRFITALVALILAAGEIARWWNSPRFVPLAFDELLVAFAMLWAAQVAGKKGAAPLVAAWGLFCGLMVSLLVPTLDHLLSGPPKESAVFYAVILGLMLALGGLALVRALAWAVPPDPGPSPER